MKYEDLVKVIEELKEDDKRDEKVAELFNNYLNENVKNVLFTKDHLGNEKLSDYALKELGLQGTLDKYFNKGLETWKKNNLQKIIEQEMNKDKPEINPELEELKRWKAEQEKMKLIQEKMKEVTQNDTFKSVPKELLQLLVNEDDEATNNNLNILQETMKRLQESLQEPLKKEIDELKNKFLNTVSRDSLPTQVQNNTNIDYANMSYDEIIKLEQGVE